jgi:hypothetical protein
LRFLLGLLRRRFSKLAPERIREVTITGESELERERREISRTLSQLLERGA